MIRKLRVWLAGWIQPGTPAPPTAEVVALVDRVECGDLTTPELVELAELVMCVAAAHHAEESIEAEIIVDPHGWTDQGDIQRVGQGWLREHLAKVGAR